MNPLQHNPPMRPLPVIGRDSEFADIANLLSSSACRLITLTGPGGIGKTSLALELSHQVDFTDGVYFIPLQPLRSGQQVFSTLVDVLPFPIDPADDMRRQLLDFLQDQQLLLIFDNFEHVLDGADLLIDILAAAPQVKILATSRAPLNLRNEWVRQLSGLEYPSGETLETIDEYSAVQLFVERALQQRGDFRLEDEADHIIRICQIVEGVPLTIELAAAWVRTLSCAAIATEIQERIDFLTNNVRDIPVRHRSIRAVFDQSWRLLTPEETSTMRGFVVFRGGCTLEAAREVLKTSLPTLAALVDKSLLHHNFETGRYDIQELQRQYAKEQLEASGEGDQVRDCHCCYYASLFHQHQQIDGTSAARADLIAMVSAEIDNIRTTWNWALQTENYDAVDKLLETLWMYFTDHSLAFELEDLLAQACRQLRLHSSEQDRSILGRVLARQGKWAAANAHFDHAEMMLQESMSIAQEYGNTIDYYYSMRWLARYILANHQLEYARAEPMLEACIEFYRSQSDRYSLALSLSNLADIYRMIGQTDNAKKLYLESYQVYQDMNFSYGLSEVTVDLGAIAINEGLWQQAEETLSQLLASKGTISESWKFTVNELLSWQAVMLGDFARAEGMIQNVLDFSKSRKPSLTNEFKWTMRCRLSRVLIADAKSISHDTQSEVEAILNAIERRGGAKELAELGHLVRGWVLCNSNQFDAAAKAILPTLQSVHDQQFRTANVLFAIATSARIMAGISDSNPTRAVELLGFVFAQPHGPHGYLEQHIQTKRLREKLAEEIGIEEYEIAWEYGSQLEVEQVALRLLTELAPDSTQPMESPKQPLIEPLTARELEVTQLLADGLNSREIADHLVLSVGTIRWYIKQIYSKLHVHSRSEAISRAKGLKLVL